MGNASTSPPAPDAVNGLLDFGRNRLHLAVGDSSGQQLIALDPPRSGLVVRWVADGRCERLSDRVMHLASSNPSHAADLVGGIRSLAAGALGHRPLTRVAVPTAMGPVCRQIVQRHLASDGASPPQLVERPVAALAEWLATRTRLRGDLPSGLVLTIDNDGGELSGLVVDLSRKLLLSLEPLSTGPSDDVDATLERLRSLAAHSVDGATDPSWPAVSSAFELVVTSGSGASHPEFTAMLDQLFPATPRTPATIDPLTEHAAINGLAHLDVLAEFRCAWPTEAISSGDQVIRAPGPWRPSDEHPVVVSIDETLITNSEIGGQPALPLMLPPSLGVFPTLRLTRRGQLVVSGDATRPYVLDTLWPAIPASTEHDPTTKPPPSVLLPEAVDHVEPELGGHP